jgi:hypothetical protein
MKKLIKKIKHELGRIIVDLAADFLIDEFEKIRLVKVTRPKKK